MKFFLISIAILFFFSEVFSEEYLSDQILRYDDGNASADSTLGTGTPVDGAWFSNSFDIPFEVPCRLMNVQFFADRSGLVNFTKVLVAAPDYGIDLNGNAPNLASPEFTQDNYTPVNGINEIALGEKIFASDQRIIAGLRFPVSTKMKVGVDFNDPWAKKSFMTFTDYITPPTGSPVDNNFIIRLSVRPIFYIKRNTDQPERAKVGAEKQNIFVFKVFSGRESVTLNKITFKYEQDGSDNLFTKAYLYDDINKNGAIDSGDAIISETTDVSGGKIKFSNIARNIPVYTLKHMILAADIDPSVENSSYLKASVESIGDVEAISGVTNSAISPYLYMSQGDSVYLSGTVKASKGTGSPADGNVTYNAKDIAVLSIDITSYADNITLKKIPLFVQGNIVPYQDIDSISLYRDNGVLGVLDSGDVEIAPPVNFSILSPEADLIPVNEQIFAGDTGHYLIAVSLSGLSEGGNTFYFSVDPNRILSVNPQAENIYAEGADIVSGTFTVSGGLAVSKLASSPDNLLVSKGKSSDVFFFSASSSGESAYLKDLKLSISGDITALGKIKIFEDVNKNSVFDASDNLLAETDSAQNLDFNALNLLLESGKEKWIGLNVFFNSSLKGGSFFQFILNEANGLGSGSSVSVSASGLPLASGNIIGRGKMSILKGASSPAQKILLPGMLKEPLLQLKILAEDDEFTIDSISFSGEGTADKSILFTKLYLINDINGDGSYSTGDQILAESNFQSEDSDLQFDFSLSVKMTTYIILAADIDMSLASKGRSFSAVFDSASSVTASYSSSGLPVTADGIFPIYSPLYNIGGGAVVSKGQNSPQNIFISDGETNVPILQFCLSGGIEDFYFRKIIFSSISQSAASKISSARLVLDTNKSGTADNFENSFWDATPQNSTFTFQTDYMLPESTSECMLLLISYEGIVIGDTFQISLDSIESAGQESGSGDVSGLPLISSKHIAKGGLEFSYTQKTGTFQQGEQIAIFPFRLQSTGEDFNIITVNAHGSGTGSEDSDIKNVTIIEDADSNGIYSEGDIILSSSYFTEDDGTIALDVYSKIEKNRFKDYIVLYDMNNIVTEGAGFKFNLDSLDFSGSISGGDVKIINKGSGFFYNNSGIAVSLLNESSRTWVAPPFPRNADLNGFYLTNKSSKRAVVDTLTFDLTGRSDLIDNLTIYADTNNSGILDAGDIALSQADLTTGRAVLGTVLEKNEKRLFFIETAISANAPSENIDIILNSLNSVDDESNTISATGLPVLAARVSFYGDISFFSNDHEKTIVLTYGEEPKTVMNFTASAMSAMLISGIVFDADLIPEGVEFTLNYGSNSIAADIGISSVAFDFNLPFDSSSETVFELKASLSKSSEFLPFRLRLSESGLALDNSVKIAGLPISSPLIVNSPSFSFKADTDFKQTGIIRYFSMLPILSVDLQSGLAAEVKSITPIFNGDAIVKKFYIFDDTNKNSVLDSHDIEIYQGTPDTDAIFSFPIDGEKRLLFLADIDETAKAAMKFSVSLRPDKIGVYSLSGDKLPVSGTVINSEPFVIPSTITVAKNQIAGSMLDHIFTNIIIASFSVAATGDNFAMNRLHMTERLPQACSLNYSIYKDSVFISGGIKESFGKIVFNLKESMAYDGTPSQYSIIAASNNCTGVFSAEISAIDFVAQAHPDFIIKGLPFSTAVFSAGYAQNDLSYSLKWMANYLGDKPTPLFILKNTGAVENSYSLDSSSDISLSGGTDRNGDYIIDEQEKLFALSGSHLDFTLKPYENILFTAESVSGAAAEIYINGMPAGILKKEPLFAEMGGDGKTLLLTGITTAVSSINVKSDAAILSYIRNLSETACEKNEERDFSCRMTLKNARETVAFSERVTGISGFYDSQNSSLPVSITYPQNKSGAQFGNFRIEEGNIVMDITLNNADSLYASGTAGQITTQLGSYILPSETAIPLSAGINRITVSALSGQLDLTLNNEKQIITEIRNINGTRAFIHGRGIYSTAGFIPDYEVVAENEMLITGILSASAETMLFDEEGNIQPVLNTKKALIGAKLSADPAKGLSIKINSDGYVSEEFSLPVLKESGVNLIYNSDGSTALYSDSAGEIKWISLSLESAVPIETLGSHIIMEVKNGSGWEKASFAPLSNDMLISPHKYISEGTPLIFRFRFAGSANFPDNTPVYFRITSLFFLKEGFGETGYSLDSGVVTEMRSSELTVISESNNSLIFSLDGAGIAAFALSEGCALNSPEAGIYAFTCNDSGVMGIPAYIAYSTDSIETVNGINRVFINGQKEQEKKSLLRGGGCSLTTVY